MLKRTLGLAFVVVFAACAPRVQTITPLPEPPTGTLIENVQDDLARHGIEPAVVLPQDTFGLAAGILAVLADPDPVIREINSWYAETDEASEKADELNGARTTWSWILKIAQFGGSGAATASTGLTEVDNWVGVVGGLAAFIATGADATGMITKRLERQIHCEDLWFDRIQLKSWATQYALAQHQGNEQRALEIENSFAGWVENTAKRKYELCFSRVRQ